ncbi:MAG TPA: GNAT family N-acetyltransferase [Pseudonocardiaceae bacterium]|nr:GNAT family N-acetyltransferase [Pseudonocardiaceae bacterium]
MIDVRSASPGDETAIAGLYEEMAYFYGASSVEPLADRLRLISTALFGPVPAGAGLLAWDGSRLAAMAAYSFLWPAVSLRRSLYLKELYVAGAHRQQGVGKALMVRLFEVATEQECGRVEWTADDINLDAQRFYAGLGVPVRKSKLFYRVTLSQTP